MARGTRRPYGVLAAIGIALAAVSVRPVARTQGAESADRLLTRLAIDTAPDGDIDPITLDGPNGPLFHVYDRFRLAALAAREAWRAGRPLDPSNPPDDLLKARTVILAFARTPMGGDAPPAQAVQIVRQNGRADRIGRLDDTELAALLPGVVVPPLTVGVAFAVPSLLPSDRVVVVFNTMSDALANRGAGFQPGQLASAVSFTPPKAIDTPQPATPPGVEVPPGRTVVHVQGVLDLTGQIRYARAIDGPPALQAIAVDTVSHWRYEPARMFKAAVPLVMRADVTFSR